MKTIAEMKLLDCPVQSQVEGSTVIKIKCDPELCAMWRWVKSAERRKDEPSSQGYCGLGGVPHEFIP